MEKKEKISFSDKTGLYKKIGIVLGGLGKYTQATEKLKMCRGKNFIKSNKNLKIKKIWRLISTKPKKT